MPIPTGRYFIVNVQTKNRAYLPNPNSEEPIQGRFRQHELGEQWIITERDNGHHTIQNIGHKQYAASGSRSQAGEPVRGREKYQTWLIQKTTGKGQYTISTTDTKIFWGLVDGEQGTPIALADAPTNQQYWWMFKDVETGNDANVDPDLDNKTAADDTIPRAVFLIELAPPPDSHPEPFELDLAIIQEMPYNRDFTGHAIETANMIRRKVIKANPLKPSNLLVQVIEFESFQEAYRFRSFGPNSFDNLRRYRSGDFPWTKCSQPVIPYFLKKGMDGFRSSATKVIILNLKYIPLHNGGREKLRKLINKMIDNYVILILALSEPYQFDTLFNTDLFQELAKLPAVSILSLPADKDGFYPCIVDYLQNFDIYTIKTNSNYRDVVTIDIYSRQHQHKRLDEPCVYKSLRNSKPGEVMQGGPSQPSASLPSVAPLPGPSKSGKAIQVTPTQPSSALQVDRDKATLLHTSEDLDEDIVLLREALNLRPVPHADRSEILNDLATALATRSEQHGTSEDLDEAIVLLREALELCPAPHPDRPEILNDLATDLATRSEQRNTSEDLEEAIVLGREAVDLRPAPHPDRSDTLYNLACDLATRSEQHGTSEDLDEAIVLLREALDLRPARHSYRSEILNDLPLDLATRSKQHGISKDLDEAIVLLQAALLLCPEPHPKRSETLHKLTFYLATHFEQHGTSEDLDEAILLLRAALHLCPAPHPKRSETLYNLALNLATRSEQLGAWEDLYEAIVLGREVLDLWPAPHPDRPKALSNLACDLATRSEQHGTSEDLDEAIVLLREALELCPAPHPDRSETLNNLAIHLATRSEQQGTSEDLDEAIGLGREALDLQPAPHPDRSLSLNNLAIHLAIRSKQHGTSEDLDEAIVLGREALDLRPAPHRDRSVSLNNLADTLEIRFQVRGDTNDHKEAKSLRRKAEALVSRT